MIFAVLAAFVMSLGFMSCGPSTPEEKMVSIMEDALSILKDTHIKSADDAKAFVEKFKPLKEEANKVIEEFIEQYKDSSPEELAKSMEELQKNNEKIGKELEAEIDRLEKEAKDAGVDLDALGLEDLL